MKAFSPAGMAVKAFLGPGPRYNSPGARPWGNFGNPLGKLSGNGNNAPVGGGGKFSGTFNLTAGTSNAQGFSDGVLDPPYASTGAVAPASLNGFAIGLVNATFIPAGHHQGLILGMYGNHAQTDFTSISFIDQFGTPQSLLSANANFAAAPSAQGFEWAWGGASGTIGNGAYFLTPNVYAITIA